MCENEEQITADVSWESYFHVDVCSWSYFYKVDKISDENQHEKA